MSEFLLNFPCPRIPHLRCRLPRPCIRSLQRRTEWLSSFTSWKSGVVSPIVVPICIFLRKLMWCWRRCFSVCLFSDIATIEVRQTPLTEHRRRVILNVGNRSYVTLFSMWIRAMTFGNVVPSPWFPRRGGCGTTGVPSEWQWCQSGTRPQPTLIAAGRL